MKRLLRVLDRTGDSRHSYDLSDPESTAAARRVFEDVVAKGHSVFNVKPGSNETTQRVTDFEKLSEESIAVPRIIGG